MKLNFKVYSPFFMLLIAVLDFSCTEKPEAVKINLLHEYTIKNLKEQQKNADRYYENEDYYNAYRLYVDLKEKWLDINDYDNAGYICLKMAAISYKTGNYTESESTAVEALGYLKTSGSVQNLATLYNQLGVSYRKLYDYENAILNYKKAYKYTNDSLPICTLKNNIASVYIDNKEYNKALGHLLALNKSDTVNADPEMNARVRDNIGKTYFKLNNQKEALRFLEQGLKIRETINRDKKGLISSYFNLFHFYNNKNNALAKKYALAAYNTAREIDNKEEQLSALKALIRIGKEQDRNKYILEFIGLNDSLNIKHTKDENKFAKIKYDYKDEQSKRLQSEAEQAKSALKTQQDELTIWILTGTALIIVGVFIFVYKIQKYKHKKDKVIEVYNTESRISKKIHDELANDVFKVMTFAESDEIQYPGQQKLLHDLDAIYAKTRDISHENNTIDTGEKFGEILRQMLADYKTASVNVISSNFDTVRWNQIGAHKKIAVYRVLHELMVNMKKHSGAKLVVLKFSLENNKVLIQYIDNGRGIKNDQFLKNGLQNAENRILAIGGSLIFESSTSGLKVNCTFPV